MIEISLIHGSPYLWHAEDVCTAREQHRIVGTLIGCLPRAPQQNGHLGLPVRLLPEEAALLLKKGFAVLVDNSLPPPPPSPEQVVKFQHQRKRLYEEQAKLAEPSRKQEMEKLRQTIIEGKRAKHIKLLDKRKLAGENVSDADYDQDIDFNIEDVKIPPLQESSALIQIHTSTPDSGPQGCEVTWSYPSSDQEKLRYRTFEDFWEQGYYLTSGGKFGGDFLVYPGDPARYHSFYILVCVPYRQPISTLDMVAMGRLGSSVKKTVIMSSLDESDRICHTSLQWTGIN